MTRGQIVAVVETTKAAVEVECWHEGTVGELLVPVGETVQVGTPLATLLEPGEQRRRSAAHVRPPAQARGRRRPGGAGAGDGAGERRRSPGRARAAPLGVTGRAPPGREASASTSTR